MENQYETQAGAAAGAALALSNVNWQSVAGVVGSVLLGISNQGGQLTEAERLAIEAERERRENNRQIALAVGTSLAIAAISIAVTRSR